MLLVCNEWMSERVENEINFRKSRIFHKMRNRYIIINQMLCLLSRLPGDSWKDFFPRKTFDILSMVNESKSRYVQLLSNYWIKRQNREKFFHEVQLKWVLEFKWIRNRKAQLDIICDLQFLFSILLHFPCRFWFSFFLSRICVRLRVFSVFSLLSLSFSSNKYSSCRVVFVSARNVCAISQTLCEWRLNQLT